ncbi:MAG TPA: hypothetical protein VGH63_12495 [Polyangia bacterium]
MNVEDSYEGAVRRLQRLEMAGIAMESPPLDGGVEAAREGDADRMRELEELAMLACEDNERLKREFGTALQELDDARRDAEGVRAELERLQRETAEARLEIEQLRAYVASLEQTLASAQQAQQVQASAPQQPFAAPQQPFAAPQQSFAPEQPFAAEQSFAPEQPFAPRSNPFAPQSNPFASPQFASEPLAEEDFGYPPKSRGKGALYFCVVALAGVAVAALCVIRPWDRPHAPPIAVEQPAPPPPVVTAPPPAPKIEPALPKVAPTPPKVVAVPAVVPVHKARASKARAERKRAKHHAAKKSDEPKVKTVSSDSNDPLGGTGL